MKIFVYPDLGIACEGSVEISPEGFHIIDDVAVAIKPDEYEGAGCCIGASEVCPTGAIGVGENV
ncbi:hypothetical protein KAH81_02520 [bacterium]|nr:hypothetical protein [bacterium]